MKKLMLAVLVGLMAFAASASIAAAEVTVGGELEMRYDLWYNLDLDNSSTWEDEHEYKKVNTQTFFADRILLNVDAKITEGLEAFVELDTMDSERVWGANHVDNGAVSPVNYQAESFAVRQAWINFMVPGIPVGVKIGHQPLALGHGISLNTSRMGTDAILVYSKPIPELLVAGVYAKVLEGSSSAPGTGYGWAFGPGLTGLEHKDADVWAALANYTYMPGNSVGINYLFVHDGSTGGSFEDDTAMHLHNIGVTADGVIGPITYKAEYDYQDVNINYADKNHGLNHGHAFMIGADAKIAMAKVGMEVAYGTGSNPDYNMFPWGTPAQFGSRTYYSPYGETSYNYAFLYNDKIGQGVNGGGGGFGFGDGTGGFGLANTGYVKVTGGINPTDKLGVDMAVLYLRASEPLFDGQSRNLGWEIDAHAGYKIYDNLNLDVTGGVFLPGGFYKDMDGEADTAYGLETKLTCKF